MFKKILASALAVMTLVSHASVVGAMDAPLQPDLDEGCLGEMIITGDGQRYVYIQGELQPETRADWEWKETLYNGYIFEHRARWTSSYKGKGAEAETVSYAKGNRNNEHYHYTRVRIQDSLLPGVIDEDTGRVWGTGYTHAKTAEDPAYYDELQYVMRSYWGDETTI